MKLTAAMILRDQDDYLPTALKSIQGVCDEIIAVLDHQAYKDSTPEVLKEYGAKVYYHPWLEKYGRMDYGNQRNYSLQYAEDNGADWIFIIDADEELTPFDIPVDEFKRRLGALPPKVHGLSVQLEERNSEGEVTLCFRGVRFFKAGVGFHYINSVHNRPKISKGYAVGTDILMYHYGYSDPELMKTKRANTLALLDERLEADPNDFNALFYKCMSLLGQGDRIEEAIDCGVSCMEKLSNVVTSPDDMYYYGILYYALTTGYLQLQDGANAYRWAYKGLQFWPNDLDLNFIMAEIGYLAERNDLVNEHGQIYLEQLPKYYDELSPKLDKWFNARNNHDLIISYRHVHCATQKHKELLLGWMEEAA